MKNPFNHVATESVRRNQFDLSCERKQTQQMGDLVPCYLEEVVPGDTFNHSTEALVRFAPMLAPLMHRVDVHIHYFYIPFRILWSEWEDFITGGEDGTDLPSFPRYQLTTSVDLRITPGSLGDYLGIPPDPGVDTTVEFSALPFRAYQKVYNEYYRDQNLTDEITVSEGSGVQNDEVTMMVLRKRAWEKDYFTSCLPWTQRGTEISLPLGTEAPIEIDSDLLNNGMIVMQKNTTNTLNSNDLGTGITGNLRGTTSGIDAYIDPNNMLIADLTNATAATVNQLREALTMQRWLELSARAGSRYIEQIHAHYNVRVQDYRLQRPEFLGGGKTPVMISEVLNTYQDQTNTNDTPVGEMFGHGVSVGEQNGYNAFFPEHGLVLGIISIVPRTAYQTGVHKSWFRFDKFDYYFPTFAHLGEQEVTLKELYFTNSKSSNDTVFGYQQRYAEYKYANSTTHGDFREDFDYWHLTRKFSSAPTLNTSFIECNPDQRIFAVTDTTVHKCWVSLFHKVSAQRPIPYFAIPSI